VRRFSPRPFASLLWLTSFLEAKPCSDILISPKFFHIIMLKYYNLSNPSLYHILIVPYMLRYTLTMLV